MDPPRTHRSVSSRREARAAWALLAAVLALGGCKRSGPASPLAPPPKPAAATGNTFAPDGGIHHTERLAWSGWRQDGAFRACHQSDASRDPDHFWGACQVVERPGAQPVANPNFRDPAFLRDDAPFDRAPGGCHIRFEDILGNPGGPPARATLAGPTTATVLDAWSPARGDTGDYFALETSFSPDGKWMAVLHLSIGIGDEGRLIQVTDVAVRPAPACR